MLVLYLVCVLLSVINVQSLNPDHPKIRHKRLIGGDDTTIDKFPYQVRIVVDDWYSCGGAILSKNYIITAAHCVDRPKEVIQIYSDSTLVENDGTLHNVTDIVLHESYTLNEFNNSNFDLAVVRVSPPFEYGNLCRPIKLFKKVVPDNFEFNSKVVMSGWGWIRDWTVPDQLQTLQLPWISKERCNELFKPFGGIYEGQVCTGYIGVRNKDVCPGDSGSPLVHEDKLIGVAAYTEGQCGLLDYPTVYTEVAYFIDWIEKHVEFDKH